MQAQKPKRSLPIPPVTSLQQERSPSRYHERDSRHTDHVINQTRDNYANQDVRRREYQSSHSDQHTLQPGSHSPRYDSHGLHRELSPHAYREPHSPRSGRIESPHISDHQKSTSSHSLKRENQQRSLNIESQSSHRLYDDHRHNDLTIGRISPTDYHPSDYLHDPHSRPPHIGDAGTASWQRSSLPARTRPRSPTSPINSWQRSSLPAHTRNRISQSPTNLNTPSRISENHIGSNRYPALSDSQNGNRPPFRSSQSEPHSYSFKKRHADTRTINLSSYNQTKDYERQDKYDKGIKDANSPYEVHFKHRRNSSLDVPSQIEPKMKRSSTNYRDFLHSASLDDHARAALRKEAEEDEAYRILKEGLQIAKSRVVYKFDRSMSKQHDDRHMPHDPHNLRDHGIRRTELYDDRDYDRYHTPTHHDIYQSRGELDRMSHHSNRSNPLESISNSYRHNSRPYMTHDPYSYSPLPYNHHITYDPGSHVTQTSTQTDETSLSAPYTSYRTIPNQFHWMDDNKPKPKRNFLNCFNFNFFRNRKSNKKNPDNKFIYMKSPAPQHCTQVIYTL